MELFYPKAVYTEQKLMIYHIINCNARSSDDIYTETECLYKDLIPLLTYLGVQLSSHLLQ